MADTKSSTGMPLPDAVAGNFQEAMRWFNQLWGGAGDAAARGSGPIPSMFMPTLDVQELDKRIADLRSVEHWLKLNQGMLQTTIQGLEMQRNTLSAWQSFGAATAGAGASAGTTTAPKEPPMAGPGAVPAFDPAQWWSSLQQQFAQMAAAATAADAATGPGAVAESRDTAPGTRAAAASARSGPGKAANKPRGGGSASD